MNIFIIVIFISVSQVHIACNFGVVLISFVTCHPLCYLMSKSVFFCFFFLLFIIKSELAWLEKALLYSIGTSLSLCKLSLKLFETKICRYHINSWTKLMFQGNKHLVVFAEQRRISGKWASFSKFGYWQRLWVLRKTSTIEEDFH